MTLKPNPDYESAEYEDCIIDKDGRVLMVINRYRNLQDAMNKNNPVSPYIVAEEQHNMKHNKEVTFEEAKIKDFAPRSTEKSGVCLAPSPTGWFCTKPKGHAGNHSCHMLDFMP